MPGPLQRVYREGMKAKVGDRLIMEGAKVGDVRRVGVVLEVRHDDGTPPYLVRWLSDGHEALVFPGSDSHIEIEEPA
jgi:uncharacterized protein DUF1918